MWNLICLCLGVKYNVSTHVVEFRNGIAFESFICFFVGASNCNFSNDILDFLRVFLITSWKKFVIWIFTAKYFFKINLLKMVLRAKFRKSVLRKRF